MDDNMPESFLSDNSEASADLSANQSNIRPSRAAKTGALNALTSNIDMQNNVQRNIAGMDVSDVSCHFDALEMTPRKRRTSDVTGSVAKRGRGGGTGRKGRGGRRSALIRDDEHDQSSLFAILKAGKAAPMVLVDDWVSDYKQSPDGALLRLLQLFIDAAGCRSVLTQHMLMSGDFPLMVRKMTDEFDEDSHEYPIIINAALFRRFKTSFTDFIFDLVDKCKQEIIYDQKLMDSVIQLLVVLADSQVRAFRHTATLAAMKLETSLVSLFVGLAEDEAKNSMQLENEKRKQRASGGGNERLELLISKKQEYTERMEEIRQMMTYLFKSVFIHRYRDVVPEIRSICIGELAQWILTLPSVFLDDLYLKYIGWTLHDKMAEVRLKCLQALCPLYENPESAPKLVLFSHKFKGKIVSMVLDKEFDVAVQAVKVVTALMKGFDNLLDDTDQEKIYELVFCTHRGLATAAGEFVNQKLFAPDAQIAADWRTSKGKEVSVNSPLIRDLIMFFIESELHRHGAYLVDSLIETHPMLKDWAAMSDLLLEQVSGPDFQGLDDRQERVLIDIMVCAVKQTATGEPPTGRTGGRKHGGMREHRVIAEERTTMTEHFIVTLPLLLQKYVADAEELDNLLEIATYFDLNVYVNGRHDKHLENLMRRMEELVEKHWEEDLLKKVCKVLGNVCDQTQPFFQRCHTHKVRLLDAIVLNFKNNLQQFINEESVDREDLAALKHSVAKVVAFHHFHDLSQWNVYDGLLSLGSPSDDVTAKISTPVQSTIIREKALTGCFLSVLWSMHALRETHPTTQAIELLCNRRDIIVKTSLEFMHLGDNIFLNVCDLLVLCNSKQPIEQLRFKLNDYNPLTDFIQDNVFQAGDDTTNSRDQEQAILKIHRKRKLLAAYCKMIIYGVLPITEASHVIKHYLELFDDFGDIMKYLMQKCREVDRLSFSSAVSIALQQQYSTLEGELSEPVDPYQPEFMKIRDLAKRLALTFGPDAKKIREPIAMLHKEGIAFVLKSCGEVLDSPPDHLPFLEVIMEFTSRLLPQDKKAVLRYLDKQIGDGFGDGNEWHSLLLYRNSLIQDEINNDVSNITNTTKARGNKRGQHRPAPSVTPDASEVGMDS